MSDFSLPTLFVVPVGNTLPTTGSTETLTLGQFGITKDSNRAAATAGNVSSANYIQIVQGRPGTGMGTKISDKIKVTKLKTFYKISAEPTATAEIWNVGSFNAKCDETVTLAIQIHSSYSEILDPNGVLKTVSIQTPCCDCGADPCTSVSNETVVDLFMAKIAQTVGAQVDGFGAIKLNTYVTFEKVGTSTAAVIRITTKPLPTYTNSGDFFAFTYEFDRVWFRPFVTKGAATTSDFLAYDNCDVPGVVTLQQRSTYLRGSAAEIRQLQKDYASYQLSPYKELFNNPGFNQQYEDYVTDGTFYDFIVMKFDELGQNDAWTQNIQEDEIVMLAIPTSQTAAIQTILVAYLGAIDDKSPAVVTSTTTTSTSSTTSTSTTQIIP